MSKYGSPSTTPEVHSGFYWGYIGVVLGIYWDNGKENGNYPCRRQFLNMLSPSFYTLNDPCPEGLLEL